MKNILITGPPGIGKTTLVKKIKENLNKLQIACDGFYTEEVMQNGSRIGFDIVTFEGKKAVLARKMLNQYTQGSNMPTVGQYSVYLEDFEKLALPVFEKASTLLIIDEIGKMELLSKRFQDSVTKVIENENIRLIATVPLKATAALVKQLKEEPSSNVIMVIIPTGTTWQQKL